MSKEIQQQMLTVYNYVKDDNSNMNLKKLQTMRENVVSFKIDDFYLLKTA